MKSIDKIVIVACGKGTRLYPMTLYVPKILINLGNDNILAKIIKYWSKYCNNFIILINKEYNDFIEYYLKKYDYISYEIRNIEINNNEENSYTIKMGLYGLENQKLLLTWCDLFPDENIDFSLIKNNCIMTNIFQKCRYYADENNNIIKLVSEFEKGNVIGIYYFNNYKKLINDHDKQDICDCYLKNYNNFCTYEINNIIDVGDNEKLNNYFENFNIDNKLNSSIDKIIDKITNNISYYNLINKLMNDIINIKTIIEKFHYIKYVKNIKIKNIDEILSIIKKNIDNNNFNIKYLNISKNVLSLFGFEELNNNNLYYFEIINENLNTNIDIFLQKINKYKEIYSEKEYDLIIFNSLILSLNYPLLFTNNILKLIGSYFHFLSLFSIFIPHFYICNENSLNQ